MSRPPSLSCRQSWPAQRCPQSIARRRTVCWALSAAAGVPLVGQALERSDVHRAVRHTGWPLTRWLRRMRADPLSRLRLGGAARPGEPVAATSIGPAAPAGTAAVGLALRAIGDQSGRGLAPPWPAAVLDAARSRQADLPDALDAAVASTDLGMPEKPAWWRVVGLCQTLFLAAAAIGLAWLAVRYLLFAIALPEPPMPGLGRVPWPTVLLVGGLLGGVALATLTRPVVSVAARRRRRRATRRLNAGVLRVGTELVLAPVDDVRRTYAEARKALQAAGQ